MESLRNKKAFVCDMDGVLYHGNALLPGVNDFVAWLRSEGKRFLFLTNSSERTPKDLSAKLARMGVEVEEEHFYTSALATANFLRSQKPGCSAYVIGEAGLFNALYEAGVSMNNVDPDYVVVGDTRGYSYEQIEKATLLVQRGAKLIGTNPDTTGPTEKGIVPSTGALIAPIEMAAGMKAYFIGKPNPLMMRRAVKSLGCASSEAVIIGDRMDTDIIAGIEAEVDTILVLSGVSTRETAEHFAYRPRYVFSGLQEMMTKIKD